MARRAKDQSFNPLSIFGIAFACWVLAKILGPAANAVFSLIIIAAGVILVRKFMRPGQLRESALSKAGATITEKMPELLRARTQLLRTDRYGKLQPEKWHSEVKYFVEEHILPHLTADEANALKECDVSLTDLVRERVHISAKAQPAFTGFSDDFTPTEFEAFCAGQLRAAGWDSRVTLQSRDQGIDVVAEKNGIRVVLQCKLYSTPVGNKAVQEIAAGRSHERAPYGAVVTNHRYTSAAEQLAATTDVLLLHYSDLIQFEDVLNRKRISTLSDSGS